jgi:hypothetical protein
MGGYGMRLRDGSCQARGWGQGGFQSPFRGTTGPGFFNRLFAGRNTTNSASTTLGTQELLSAIRSLQQQVDELKNQSGK